MKHKKHKKVVYPDQNLICELCDPPRSFKNYQGLRGHRRMIHGILDPIIASSGPEVDPGAKNNLVAKSSNTIETLKEENELLKLQIKNRQLAAQFPSTSREPADLMLQLGLGSFDPGVKAEAQRRAMALSGQGQAQSWLDKILDHPESFKLIAGALRGALGVDHGGDNAASGLGVLRELGIDLKSLWERGQAPRSGTLQIAGLDLQGASLTPSLLVALLDYKAKTESAQKEYEGKKEMSDSLSSLIKIITPELIAKFTGGRRESISEKYMPGSEPAGFQPFICPKCGAQNELSPDLVPGQEVKCQTEGCGEIWTVVDDRAQPKPERKKREVKVQVEEMPTSIACEGCGQLINIKNMALGSELTCPICQKTQVLTSPDVAMEPELPEEQSKFLRR